MKCQILFSRKNKKNVINLSSAALAQILVKVTRHLDGMNQLQIRHFSQRNNIDPCPAQ